MPNHDYPLATLPGSNSGERVVVLLARTQAGQTKIILRQQSWADGIGWYDQTSLELDPHQLGQLKAVLGGRLPSARPPGREIPTILAFPGVRRIESA